MTIASPIALIISLILWISISVLLLRRTTALPNATKFLILIGTGLFVLAACGLTISLPKSQNILVMLDQSPSTRTASYHNQETLEKRLSILLGTKPYRIEKFSDTSADQTKFTPSQSDAIVLFSDNQFELPTEKTTSPIYVVADPALEHPNDAAITQLDWQDDSITAAVRNSGNPRQLEINSATVLDVPSGQRILTTRADPKATNLSARLTGQDPWPENDSLSIHAPPFQQLQRWWIGDSPPSPNWQAMKPQNLPSNPTDYLAASVIALNNISADAIPPAQQDRLLQYVRDLGGGIAILGGDRSFAAGGYVGSGLDAISPLSSVPPIPQHHWIILVDSSGSMAAPIANGETRWQRAASSATDLLRRLPSVDVVSIGHFARSLTWWSQSRLVSITAKLPLPPADVLPNGPTNLQAVLQAIAYTFDAPINAEIILISDADATIDNPAELAELLRSKRIRLHLLATADASNSAVAKVSELTGGRSSSEVDPSLWSDAMRKLQRATVSDNIQRIATMATFLGDLKSLSGRSVSPWNLTWLKRDATELASAPPTDSGHAPLAAQWNFGAGRVAAVAFQPTASELDAITAMVARPPRDPRFKISWKTNSQLSVTVNAMDGDRYLNDLEITLSQSNETDLQQIRRQDKLTQTGPGRYEISIPSPRSPIIASIRVGDQTIDRAAIPGRYAPEFDHIGNNHPAMQALAQSTGGAVIDVEQNSPIDFKWPKHPVSLTSVLASLGAALIASGLLVWKLRT